MKLNSGAPCREPCLGPRPGEGAHWQGLHGCLVAKPLLMEPPNLSPKLGHKPLLQYSSVVPTTLVGGVY